MGQIIKFSFERLRVCCASHMWIGLKSGAERICCVQISCKIMLNTTKKCKPQHNLYSELIVWCITESNINGKCSSNRLPSSHSNQAMLDLCLMFIKFRWIWYDITYIWKLACSPLTRGQNKISFFMLSNYLFWEQNCVFHKIENLRNDYLVVIAYVATQIVINMCPHYANDKQWQHPFHEDPLRTRFLYMCD